MKLLFFALTSLIGFQASALTIQKQVPIRFVFHKANPFFVASEYDQCREIVADFAYAPKDVLNTYEFFPHIGDIRSLSTPCSPKDGLGNYPASQKIADELNRQVKLSFNGAVYELVVLANYTFEQTEMTEGVRIVETIKIDVPSLQYPLSLENSTYVPIN